LLGVFGVKPKIETKETAAVDEQEDDADIQVIS